MPGGPDDAVWMQRALGLAERGVGSASPNPTVGCVLVDAHNQLIGEGFHRYELRDHAEVVALREAGERARGATAFLTLEPCSHQGRTGPCADALIAAGVGRVAVATLDANPVVRGNGVARLRSAGIAVDVGLMQAEAQRLNDAFAKFIRTGLPFVTLKVALSADGFIAPAASRREERAPFWLTGAAARAEVQRLRHAHDAVLTGIGTVLADDPLLTDRSGLARRLALVRVVLDTQLRMPLESKLAMDGSGLLLFTASADDARVAAFVSRGIRVEHLSALTLTNVLRRLGELGIISVLIEAGTGINTAAVAEDCIDRLVTFQSPVVLGDGVPVLTTPVVFPGGLDDEVLGLGEDLCRTTTLHSYWNN